MKIRATENTIDMLKRYEEGSFEDCLRGDPGTPHVGQPHKHAYAILDSDTRAIHVDSLEDCHTLLASLDNSLDIMANGGAADEEPRKFLPVIRATKRIIRKMQALAAEWEA
jgi:hypothetical protein